MPAGDLHRLHGLLRIPPDTPIERLRAAYEQAMREATRAGDHQRALALSTAFDALPSTTRAQVYRNSRNTTHASIGPLVPYPAPAGPFNRRRSPRGVGAPRRRRWGWARALAYGLGIPAIVVGGVYLSTHGAFRSAGEDPQPVVINTGPASPSIGTTPPVSPGGPGIQ